MWTMSLIKIREHCLYLMLPFSILLKTDYYEAYIQFINVYTQQLYFNTHQKINKRVFWIYFCYIFNCLWGCKMSIYLYIILAVQLKHSMSINLNSYDKIVSKHVYCNILHSALPFITPWIGVIFHIRHTEVTILWTAEDW